MNKLIALFLIFTQTAWAVPPPTAVQGQSDTSPQTKSNFQVPYSQKTDLGGVKALFETGNKNLLANPSFEHTTATTSWTTTKLTGTTFTSAADSTNFSDGKKSLLGTLTAATGEISQDVTPAIQTNGVPMVAACRVLTTGTDVQVCARTGGSDITCNTVASAGNWSLQSVNFTGPSNGTTVGVSVKNTTSNTETFNMDDCYVGLSSAPQNFGQVSQAQFYGQIVWNGCTQTSWSRSNTSLGAFGAGTSCSSTATGNASAPLTLIPGIKFATLPPGDYMIVTTGQFGKSVSTANGSALFQFNDGTNYLDGVATVTGGTSAGIYTASPGFTSHVTYSTAQSGITLQVHGAVSATTNSQAAVISGGTDALSGTSGATLTIAVYRFPSSTEYAYRSDVLPSSWSGYSASISGGCSTTSATYADPSACTSIAVTQTTAQNLSCSQAASSAPGITCTFPRAGVYPIYANVNLNGTTSGSAVSARLVDGSATIIDAGRSNWEPSSTQSIPIPLMGMYSVASAGSVTFKVQLAVSTGTGAILNGLATGSAAIGWGVGVPAPSAASPLLMGSVTSNSTGQEHAERANFTCSSSSAINSQSGSWASSIGNISSGKCSVTVTTGEFSGTPVCPTDRTGTAVTRVSCHANPTSSTNVDLYCVTDAGAADTTCTCDTICMGPR